MNQPRILITNNTLAKPAGTELSVLDYAASLHGRGYEVAVFSAHLGEIAERLRAKGVVVVDDFDQLQWHPNLIHGHHSWETTLAALRFGTVPVVSFCRGPYNWQEAPCQAPNVVLWAAVDEDCRERLVTRHGVHPDKVEMVFNGVDLDRFRLRKSPVSKVGRVLVFSNYASEQNYLPAVRSACEQIGAELTVIGSAVGNIHSSPQEILGDYDLVFAKGKAALEALAVGCAVIVCDTAGLGPVVTSGNIETLRRQSFGNLCMTAGIDEAGVAARISQIRPQDVSTTTKLVRDSCGLSATIDQLEKIYSLALKIPFSLTASEQGEFAARFLASHTHAYKLGRKTQEFWHDRRESEVADDKLDALKVDRVLDAFFNAEAKREKVEIRLKEAKTQIKILQKRLVVSSSLTATLNDWLKLKRGGNAGAVKGGNAEAVN